MEELQAAIRYVVVIVATMVAMLLGDYLGYKIGRKKLVWVSLGVIIMSIVVFAVYAALVLLG